MTRDEFALWLVALGTVSTQAYVWGALFDVPVTRYVLAAGLVAFLVANVTDESESVEA
jgi:hypothetical protein